MATPRLSTQQVAPTQRPNTLGVPRETQAAAVVGAAAKAAGVFAREVQRIDDLRVSEAELDYRMRLRQAFDDPNDGLSTKRGTQAIEALDGFRSRVQNEVTKVESRLTSETQRALFRRRAATLAQEADLRAGQYVRGETLRVQQETYEANTALDMEAIAATPENADALVRALDERTAIYADDIGMPPEAIALARAEARSKARLAQVDALLRRGNVEAARAAFDAHGEEMKTADRQRVERTLSEAAQGDRINRLANDILASSDDPVVRNERIAGIEDAKVRKAVRDIVRDEERAAKEAVDLSREQSFERLETFVQQGGNLTDPRVAADVANLSVNQRETLEKYTMAPTNDNAAWMKWYELASDPRELAKLSESEFRSYWVRLSTSHRDDAERDYRKARQEANAAGGPSYVTPQTIIARAMRVLGGVAPFEPLTAIDDKKQPMVASFELRAAEELAAERRAKGRDLTPSEMQAVVDRMQLQFVRETPSVGFNPLNPRSPRVTREREEAMAFQMTPSDTTGIFAGTTRIQLSEIPAEQLPSVDNLLRANNVPLTNTNREALYTIQQFDTDGSRTRRWLNENRR